MKPHDAIQSALTPLTGLDDAQTIVDLVGDAELALLGGASHGTHEFYAHQAAITRKEHESIRHVLMKPRLDGDHGGVEHARGARNLPDWSLFCPCRNTQCVSV